MRIISLLPSTTEIIFALGAGDHVVGVTHECDFPPEAASRDHCTGNLLPPNLDARQIDQAVCAALKDDAHSIYRLNVDKVRDLRPSVIVTQSLCAVCAVPERAVKDLSCTLPYDCQVVSSDPHTLPQLFESIVEIGNALGRSSHADALVSDLTKRLVRVRSRSASRTPRVAVLEWPDPPYAPGHWVPDMIEYAAGICVLGISGKHSVRVTWDHLATVKPDVVVGAFCGFDLRRNELEVDKVSKQQVWKDFVGDAHVYSTNASAYFSRPGNRLIDGTELLAFILHRFPEYKPQPGCASVWRNGEWIDLSQE